MKRFSHEEVHQVYESSLGRPHRELCYRFPIGR
jgi:hypothetical protein